MSKLIYVDRLKKDILDLPNCYNGFSDTYDKACIIGVIDEQPTIEERKTGHWIHHPEYETDGECGYECSECGMGSEVNYDFCMRCGADMRER